ncbi:hypothetical protein DMC30DRAFT_176831 [Rhodotorula diobovata]|uniref:MYND-type domain-containing protein n=1 Tax=Rhodotorula diobovata TaxID=5288 RepID=A0A5C5G003_9BASI|nr:hypothetical protein DMC30DRAFT_176831 [Rhodotorula diobovata]
MHVSRLSLPPSHFALDSTLRASLSSTMSLPSPQPCVICGEETTKRCSACAKAGLDLCFCSPEHQKLPLVEAACASLASLLPVIVWNWLAMFRRYTYALCHLSAGVEAMHHFPAVYTASCIELALDGPKPLMI